MSSYKDNVILYLENSKDSTPKLLELPNELSKVAGYKIKTQKLIAFLCNNNELSEIIEIIECKKGLWKSHTHTYIYMCVYIYRNIPDQGGERLICREL